jgi:hypothetical protein
VKIHQLRQAPSPDLAAALERFEAKFRYPLGRDTRFRIAHGRSYVPFFAAIGDMTLLVAEQDGEVLGTLAGIRRPLRLPSGRICTTTYLCDLKVSPAERSGRTLLRLAQHMDACENHDGGAYSVVMDGTACTPSDYTGRCGIPRLGTAGEIGILRIAVPRDGNLPLTAKLSSLDEVDEALKSLILDAHLPLGGRPRVRSAMPPVALLAPDGLACGVVEDTRLGKRLFLDSGEEMLSAHLSHFAYATPDAGARLLRHALSVASRAGFPALFVALPIPRTGIMLQHLAGLQITVATASVFAHGVDHAKEWWIDTSEI